MGLDLLVKRARKDAPVDPDQIMDEAAQVERRMRRSRNLILGVTLIIVGAVFLVLSLVIMESPDPSLFAGGIGVGVSALAVGWFRIARGLTR
jgi:hypothetical protein